MRCICRIFALSFLAVIAMAQDIQQELKEIPAELHVLDPDARKLWIQAIADGKTGKLDVAEKSLSEAIQLCTARKILSDCAVLKAGLGQAKAMQGNFEAADALYREALILAKQSGNSLLEADLLISQAIRYRISNDATKAKEQLSRAVELARNSKNKKILARAFGEQANTLLWIGEIQAAETSVKQAIGIDEANDYDASHHYLYHGQILRQKDRDPIAAEQLLQKALTSAQKKQNFVSFIMASIELARIAALKGEIVAAVELLQHCRSGRWRHANGEWEFVEGLKNLAALPYMRLALSGTEAELYLIANRSTDALRVYSEIQKSAAESGQKTIEAYAALEAARLALSLNTLDEAERFARIAITELEELGFSNQVRDAKLILSDSFMGTQRYGEAISTLLPLVPIARQGEDVNLVFTLESEVGRAYFLQKNFKKAIEHWRKADHLVQLLLDDPKIEKPNLANRLGGHYRGMLAIYIEEKRPILALMTWVRAVAAMQDAGDETQYNTFFRELGNAIEQLKVRDWAEEAYNERNWLVALTLNQILLEHTSRVGVKFQGARDFSGKAFERVVEIPLRMLAEPEGASLLEDNLAEMGPVSWVSRRVGYDALLRNFLERSEPKRAYGYGQDLLPMLLLQGATVSTHDAEAICIISFAAFQSGEESAARQHLEQCKVAVGKLQEPNPTLAHLVVQLESAVFAFEDPARARQALLSIINRVPDDEAAQMRLANVYVNEGKLADALSIWDKMLSQKRTRHDVAFAGLNLTVGKALMIYSPGAKYIRDPLPYLRVAEEAYSRNKDVRGRLVAQLAIADYWIRASKRNEALRSASDARSTARSLSDPMAQADAAAKVAEVKSKFEEREAATTERSTAIKIYRANIQTAFIELVAALIEQGKDLDALGRFPEAIDSFREAIRLADKHQLKFHRRWARSSLGELFSDRNEYLLAIPLQKEALAIAEVEEKDRLGAGWSALNLGWSYFNIGEWGEARKAAETAIGHAKPSSNSGLEFFALNLLMNLYADRRSPFIDVKEALSAYKRAEELSATDENLNLDVLSETIAMVYWRAGDVDAAIRHAEEACKHNRRESDHYSLAHSLMSLTEGFIRKGELAEARKTLQEVKKVIRTAGDDTFSVGRFHYTTAQLLRAEGKHSESAATYEVVLSHLEKLKGGIRDTSAMRKAADTYSFVYDELVDLFFLIAATETKRDYASAKALEYAEAEKAREFLSAWGPLFAERLRSDLPLPTREREQFLHYEVEQAIARAIKSEAEGRPDAVKKARENEQTAKKNLQEFIESLRAAHPSYASVKHPRPLNYTSVHRQPGETLVAYRVTPDQTYVWIISDEGILFEKVERPREWFRTIIEAIRDSFNRNQLDPSHSGLRQLFTVLFSSRATREKLSSAKLITVIPDDVLFLVPLETFTTAVGEFPLLEKPIRYFPSLAAYVLSENLPRPDRWTTELLAFGNPAFTDEDPTRGVRGLPQELVSRGLKLEPLPGTQREVEDIAALFPKPSVLSLTGKEATKQRVINTDLSSVRFLHFATHGLLPTDSSLIEPALAFAALSDNDTETMLQMSEVLQLKLGAEMVVLSACNTGSGAVDRVEGVHNLGRAFLLAGARSAVMSLWQVADDSTALLMHEFYRNILAGQKKSQALAAARATVHRRGFSDPFFWAPFVLMGD
jgi:CHAT domain-containing protein